MLVQVPKPLIEIIYRLDGFLDRLETPSGRYGRRIVSLIIRSEFHLLGLISISISTPMTDYKADNLSNLIFIISMALPDISLVVSVPLS